MKEKIHPAYYQTTVRCACGNEIPTGSTRKDIRVEICSQCHGFGRKDRAFPKKIQQSDKEKSSSGRRNTELKKDSSGQSRLWRDLNPLISFHDMKNTFYDWLTL
jgi:ribosomal protein L31